MDGNYLIIYFRVQGKEYFKCGNKHGVFLRPSKVTVGDYPEDDFDEF
jgi:tubulin-folding cofactor B